MNNLIKKLEELSEEAKYQGYAHSDNFRETSEHYFGIAEGLDIAIEQIHKHIDTKVNEIFKEGD